MALFDFIVVPGDQKLSDNELRRTSKRLVNYFLAALAVPPKDLWVNLSSVEKHHIIPQALNKTELGCDLLAAEVHYWTGGLGPVMGFHGKGMKDLGSGPNYIEPWYQYDINSHPLDYTKSNQGLQH